MVRIDFPFDYGKEHYDKAEKFPVRYEVMQHMRRHGFGVPLSMAPVEDVEVADLPPISRGALTLIEKHRITDEQLSKIIGSGKDGGILKRDIEQYLKERQK